MVEYRELGNGLFLHDPFHGFAVIINRSSQGGDIINSFDWRFNPDTIQQAPSDIPVRDGSQQFIFGIDNKGDLKSAFVDNLHGFLNTGFRCDRCFFPVFHRFALTLG